MPDVTSPGADFLARERERQKMRDLTQHDRETFPGTAGGRALPASPLEHRGRSSSRGGLFPALSPSPVGVGTPQIHHVTLTAASQSIAAGGATVQWASAADAPTERRGFDTLSTELEGGSVGDIPLDLTGELEMVLDGLWAEYRAAGDITITRIRDGISESRTFDLGPVRSRLFGGSTLGWPVKAGDTVRVDLPNDSGEDQTLAEATIGLRVIGAQGVPEEPFPEPWAWYRGDDLTGFVEDDEVRAWTDRTGNGRDLSDILDEAGTNYPLYATDAVDGQPGVKTAVNGDVLAAVYANVTLDAVSILLVVRDPDDGSASARLSPASPSDFGAEFNVYPDWAEAWPADGYVEGDPAVTGEKAILMVGSATPTLAVNGTELTVVTEPVTAPVDTTQTVIELSAFSGTAHLAEAIIWDRVLTSDEKSAVWAYVDARYAGFQ